MIEIIPAILAKTGEEFQAMVQKLEPHVKRVHLDIIDGQFAQNVTVSGWEELGSLSTPLEFDVHLMVKNLADALVPWYSTKADRFIIHVESEADLNAIFHQIRSHGKRSAVALNPETPPESIDPFLSQTEFIQFMTVHPGFYHSPFVEKVVEKIRHFHTAHPTTMIAVDGGITPETVPKIVEAGATILVSGSYIANSPDSGAAIQELQSALTRN